MAMTEQRTEAQALQLYESARPRRNERRHHSFAAIYHFNLCFATFGRAASSDKAEEAADEKKKDEEPRTVGGWRTLPYIIGKSCYNFYFIVSRETVVEFCSRRFNLFGVQETRNTTSS